MYNDSFRKRYKSAPVAISENTEPYDTPAHIHREIELLFIKEGKAEITVSDRHYFVSEGDVVIVNPMDVHLIKADITKPYHQRCICFDSSLIADKNLREGLLSANMSILELHSKNVECTNIITKLFDLLFESVSENSDELFLESVAYISLIFVNLKKRGMISAKKSSAKKINFERKLQDYLSEHFSEQITSQTVSKELFYNQSYFCRVFRENFGVSFLEYLTLYRISCAKLMLSSEDIRISDVAERVGFLDASYFSRCFKKIIGISPVEYQKRQSSAHTKSI